eukprot:COSAG02_NODE_2697_length_8213_cov_3.202736_1_plen_146_part_00
MQWLNDDQCLCLDCSLKCAQRPPAAEGPARGSTHRRITENARAHAPIQLRCQGTVHRPPVSLRTDPIHSTGFVARACMRHATAAARGSVDVRGPTVRVHARAMHGRLRSASGRAFRPPTVPTRAVTVPRRPSFQRVLGTGTRAYM